MTLTIQLSSEEEKRLLARAEANGQDVAAYVHELVKKEIDKPLSLSAVLAPLRQEVEESGITDEELESLLREAVAEVRQERRANRTIP